MGGVSVGITKIIRLRVRTSLRNKAKVGGERSIRLSVSVGSVGILYSVQGCVDGNNWCTRGWVCSLSIMRVYVCVGRYVGFSSLRSKAKSQE